MIGEYLRLMEKYNLPATEVKYYFKWRDHLDGSTMDIGLPWITYSAIDYLEGILVERQTLFEYGSGGSTKYFCNKGLKVFSVEHDPDWYQAVKDELSHYKNLGSLQLIEPQDYPGDVSGLDPQDPDDYFSDNATKGKKYEGKYFEAYVKEIDRYPDKHFDYVLVDGRSRAACLQKAKSKIKDDGVIILDNSDRNRYTNKVDMSGYEEKVCKGFVPTLKFPTQTSFFTKE